MHTNGIITANVKMSTEDCNKLIEHFHIVQKGNPSSSYASNINYKPLHRQDESIFLNDTDSGELLDLVNSHLNLALNEYGQIFPILYDANFIGLISTRIKLQKTKVGGGYHQWHFESMAREVSERALVWTIYLNDVEEGGETEFLYHSERHKAREGKIVVFPANFLATHRGNPPISNTKYIATGWWNLAG